MHTYYGTLYSLLDVFQCIAPSLMQPCLTAYCIWCNTPLIQALYQILQISVSLGKCIRDINFQEQTCPMEPMLFVCSTNCWHIPVNPLLMCQQYFVPRAQTNYVYQQRRRFHCSTFQTRLMKWIEHCSDHKWQHCGSGSTACSNRLSALTWLSL